MNKDYKAPTNIEDYALSVIVPVLNEADNVAILLNEIKQAITTQKYEVIYIDDASEDGTWEKLTQLKQHSPELRIIRHEKNAGQSAAMITGIQAAQYDWIATLDGDLQNDPKDILKLIREHFHLSQQNPATHYAILGNRGRRQDNLIRIISSRIANFTRAKLLNDDCPDSGCSVRFFHKLDFIYLPQFRNMHRFLPTLLKRAGINIANVSVNHRPRLHGVTKYGISNRLWAGLFDLIGVFWLLKRPCNAKLERSL